MWGLLRRLGLAGGVGVSQSSHPSPTEPHDSTGPRPPLEIIHGTYFRWAQPAGWQSNETIAGVDLRAPDNVTAVGSAILLRSPGDTNPADFVMMTLRSLPGYANLRIVAKRGLPDQSSGRMRTPWKIAELELTFNYRGVPARGTWMCGISAIFGLSFDAFIVGYQTMASRFDQDRLWLSPIANSVAITNVAGVAGNDQLIQPKNNPLDNAALIESWRQKGLSDDHISKARREGMMGYERLKDPETGRIYEMPLEAYDGTVGGYRNPRRPAELLQRTGPGE